MRCWFLAMVSVLAPWSSAWASTSERSDIVFVLGSDYAANGYFAAAADYYHRALPHAEIVSGARSLAEVREVLAATKGASPWSRIVLVAHGTEWTGLIVPLFADGEPAHLQAVVRATKSGEFPSLAADVIDADSELVIESCGLGRRADYLAAISSLFAGTGRPGPRIRAANGMVWFYGVVEDGALVAAERRELDYVATLLPGRDSAASSAEARLLRQLSAHATSSPPINPVVVRLPVHVTVNVDSADLRRHRSVSDYLSTSSAFGNEFRPHALDARRLRWLTREGQKSTDLVGDGSLLIVMQSVPGADSNVHQVLQDIQMVR